MPPCCATSASACSRERLASVPVKTKVMPANFVPFGAWRSSFILTPAAFRRSMSFLFTGSEKKSATPCATFGPTSLTSIRSSRLALASFSIEPKCEASNCAVRSPTKSMPSA